MPSPLHLPLRLPLSVILNEVKDLSCFSLLPLPLTLVAQTLLAVRFSYTPLGSIRPPQFPARAEKSLFVPRPARSVRPERLAGTNLEKPPHVSPSPSPFPSS